MAKSNVITCPVCFSKMNQQGHDLVCPSCGYKYCEDRIPYIYDDHNHNDYHSYNQKTTYSNAPSNATSTRGSSTPRARAAGKKKKSPAFRVVAFFIGFYLVFALIPFLIDGISALVSQDEPPAFLKSLFPDDDSQKQLADSRKVSPSDILEGYAKQKKPKSILQELLCDYTNKRINEISLEDCEGIIGITMSVDSDGDVRVTYTLSNYKTRTLYPEAKVFLSHEVKLFTKLNQFSAASMNDVRFMPGDLDGLKDLIYLECANTPAELSKIVDSKKDLCVLLLNHENQELDLTGLDEFRWLQAFYCRAASISNEEVLLNTKTLSELGFFLTDGAIGDDAVFANLGKLSAFYYSTPTLSNLSFLKYFPELETLQLSDTDQLSDLSELELVPSLASLKLDHVPAIKDYSQICVLQNLSHLTINHCDLDDLSWITGLPDLFYIDVSHNQLESIAPLGELIGLDEIRCSDNPIKDYGNVNQRSISD